MQKIKDDVALKEKTMKNQYMVIVKYKDDNKGKTTFYECMENVIKRIENK